MLSECIEALNLKEDGIYVDVTFGGGGHSRAIMERLTTGRLIAFDRDADANDNIIENDKFTLVKDDFRNMQVRINELGISEVDGILADLGVSSHQFDTPERGFSIRFNDEQLDMRMDREQSLDAVKVLNDYPEARLADVFYHLGELTSARKLARAICEYRKSRQILTTGDLRESIQHLIPKKQESQFLARLFQSVRIEVNQELESLKCLLDQSAAITNTGSRLAVISYHSLEDRLVKNMIAYGNTEGKDERDVYGNRIGRTFRQVNKKPVTPTTEELDSNPRSRSAKLRIAERI